MDTMFDIDSFDDLKDKDEIESAVMYFAKNEIKYKSELLEGGMDRDKVENQVKTMWKSLLNQAKKYKYSDYLTRMKEKLYK